MKKIIFLFILFQYLNCMSQTIAIQTFATGFSSPIGIENAGDNRLFVVEQTGRIKILKPDGTVNAMPFLNVSTLISTGSEKGLLGLAFHPNYATNGWFFINYTNTSGNTVIARYAVDATNPDLANPNGIILMTISQPAINHNGGCLQFGPDGFLYIGMGDGGGSGDPNGYAQNLNVDNSNPTRVYLGKMLRINVDVVFGLLNYGFPATNPFVNQAGKEEIWAIGLRNPWRFSFDDLTGDLWIADVGQILYEEVNKISAPLPTGLNFGWRCYEGNTSYNTTNCAPQNTMVAPIIITTHSTGNCSITGGFVYRGSLYPTFYGKYLFSDYCNSKIGMIDAQNNLTYSNAFSGNNFVSFGKDATGELYVSAINNGRIYKIVDSNLENNSTKINPFSIYPNPTNSAFFIQNDQNLDIKSIEVVDVLGKIMYQNKNIENRIEANFSKGIYVVKIITKNGEIYNSKLVIN